MDDKWKIKHRLVCLQLLVKPMTGEELARKLVNTLAVEYGISSETMLAAMQNRASINAAAMQTMKVLFPNRLGVGCFSHTLDRPCHSNPKS